MATTNLIRIRVGKDSSILSALQRTINYVENPEKTEKSRLVKGYHCDPRTAAEEFALEFTATMVMNGMFEDIETDGLDDMEDMLDNVDALTDATDELADGMNSMLNGAGELEDGMPVPPEIGVTLRKEGKHAVLEVRNETEDELSNDSLSHVFERFYRMDSSRNSATGGHGIGLSTASAIVKAHGGKISAHTDTGRDFIVTVTLPLH